MEDFINKTLNQLQREYNEKVESLAWQAVQESKEYNRSLDEVIHEMVDGHQWVIMTAYAKLVCYLTNQDDADVLDQWETFGIGPQDPMFWSQVAYMSMKMDMWDCVMEEPWEVEDDEDEEMWEPKGAPR